MKIYTKRGDQGNTNLIGGRTVKKNDLRVHAYGEVDELNSEVGLLVALMKEEKELESLVSPLQTIQHHLFDIGSLLADRENKLELSFPDSYIQDLETLIDTLNDKLPPIDYFVLPGGAKAAAQAHVSRTVARRVERQLVELSMKEEINKSALVYINRLSDYFFVLARFTNLTLSHDEVFYTNTGKVFHN